VGASCRHPWLFSFGSATLVEFFVVRHAVQPAAVGDLDPAVGDTTQRRVVADAGFSFGLVVLAGPATLLSDRVEGESQPSLEGMRMPANQMVAEPLDLGRAFLDEILPQAHPLPQGQRRFAVRPHRTQVLVAGADELRHAPGADTARPNRWRRKAWPTLPSDRGTMPASAKAVASEPLFRPSQGYWLSSVAQQPTVQAETVPVGRPTAGAEGHGPASADPAGEPRSIPAHPLLLYQSI
jgi:hypothetical protein